MTIVSTKLQSGDKRCECKSSMSWKRVKMEPKISLAEIYGTKIDKGNLTRMAAATLQLTLTQAMSKMMAFLNSLK